jgi:hypothetical protein
MATEAGRFTDARRAPRTTCKVCWCSVFADDDTVWVTEPNPGIAHRICAEEKPRKA